MRVRKRFPNEKTTIVLDHQSGLVVIQSPLIEIGNRHLRSVLQQKEFEKFAIKILSYSNYGKVSYLFNNKNDIQQFITNNSIPVEHTTNTPPPSNEVFDVGYVFISTADTIKFLFFDDGNELKPYQFPMDKENGFESLRFHAKKIHYIVEEPGHLELETCLMQDSCIEKFFLVMVEKESERTNGVWLSYHDVQKSPKIDNRFKDILRTDPVSKTSIHTMLNKYDVLVNDLIS